VGLSERLGEAMLARGLCTRVALDCILLAPPLAVDEDVIDRLVQIVAESIRAVVASVRA
jgi:adenosylmethionine-8-amino-7-oxononanoate aminotransferase